MRIKTLTLIAVSALALVGCGAAEQTQNVAVSPTPSDIKASALELSEEEAKAESPAEPVASMQAKRSDEEKRNDFERFMDPKNSGWTGELPPLDSLIAAAHLACEQLDSGIPIAEVEAIEDSVYKFSDEEKATLTIPELNKLRNTPLYGNNLRIVNAARSAFCPEYI